ncbi:TIGR03118 family protein [Granulicella mallensis]|uniref:TIGR03118 family protein n=1 Tax=Granulicella mallensis (strain ATCC BAA-1857 / DSM 23137 / MP5ACTX8) TaxID=682795 RepID=G8NP36_GRAMM|nr:TIGR03118 family protein [Granulicella mallensis]AEU38235.1 Conserved hypothetical protein CHP03118 [Granulicella mallensis MP5ACTX8]
MKGIFRLLTIPAIMLGIVASASAQNYTQVNLVSNVPGVAPTIDPLLGNPWGLARGPEKTWWMSDLNFNAATVYNDSGVKLPISLSILPPPPAGSQPVFDGPAGIFFNEHHSKFLVASDIPAEFLFTSIGGKIAGWSPELQTSQGTAGSTQAVILVNNTDGSAYTGLTEAFINETPFLYVANFTKGRIDVYDQGFHLVTPDTLNKLQNSSSPSSEINQKAFSDDQLPAGFAPFNVQAVGNQLVVTYALLAAGSQLETDGPGNGYVDIYSSTGRLVRRLEHGDWLNAPWGVALAPGNFGRFSNHLLIAQFAGAGSTQSSGNIAAFDPQSGNFEGFLPDSAGNPISVSGIFAIRFNEAAHNSDSFGQHCSARLYFTSGPDGGANGLFGYLTPTSAASETQSCN